MSLVFRIDHMRTATPRRTNDGHAAEAFSSGLEEFPVERFFQHLIRTGRTPVPIPRGERNRPAPGSKSRCSRPAQHPIVALVLFRLVAPWSDQHPTTVQMRIRRRLRACFLEGYLREICSFSRHRVPPSAYSLSDLDDHAKASLHVARVCSVESASAAVSDGRQPLRAAPKRMTCSAATLNPRLSATAL